MLTLQRLERLFDPAPPGVMVVSHFEAEGQRLFDEAVCGLQLEGLVAKKLCSDYQPGTRTQDWVKVKRPGATPKERFKR